MPSTVYASSNDGIALQGLNSWADCRGGGGNGTDTGVNRDNAAVQVIGSARGGGTYGIRRAFFDFDTSGITSTVATAVFILRPYGSFDTSDVIAVRSEHSGTLSNGDFNAFPADAVTALTNTDGSGGGTFVGISGLTYSSEITTWGTNVSVDNEIALNATAKADMESLDTFKICLMDNDYDYKDIPISLGTHVSIGCHFQERGGDYRPKIVYTLATVTADNATFFGTNF